MKLDRDSNPNGLGKYAVIHLRRLVGETIRMVPASVRDAVKTLDDAGLIDWGKPGADDEFFLIKLRDTHAHVALQSYADSVRQAGNDPEFADAVQALADRAGVNSAFCKNPD